MKLPRLPKMPKFRMPRPRKKLDARIRTAAPPMVDDYDADEPQTKLSSAFIVVLLLHVVAVGGIYTFNSIKSSRKEQDTPPAAPQLQTTKSALASSSAVEQDNATTPANAIPAPVPAMTASSGPKHYTVKQGDTLTSIAKGAGVSVAELETANSLKPASVLHLGQQLTIPAKGAAKPAADTAKLETAPKKGDDTTSAAPARTYTVKGGDRLLFIAKRFNVSPDELIAVNKIKDPAKLQIGQSLKIPAKKTN